MPLVRFICTAPDSVTDGPHLGTLDIAAKSISPDTVELPAPGFKGVAVIVLAVLIACFVLAGYCWVSSLHRRDDLDVWTRLVLGWTWSFGVFTFVAIPCLWLQVPTPFFLTVAGGVWVAFALTAVALFVRLAKTTKGSVVPAASGVAKPASKKAPAMRGGVSLGASGVLFASVAIVVSVWRGHPEWRQLLTTLLPALLIVTSLLAVVLSRTAQPIRQLDSADEVAPPRLWTALALGWILLQSLGVVAYSRPDWDDCYYLAAALDYQEGAVLNDQEPTHREGFPVQAIYRLMGWELWGGTLARLTGVGPLVLFHSVLPPLLVLACYGAYRAVFTEILPRRWVPLALIGLCGFHLWGISNAGNASNHFLVRLWQGKAVLLHLGIPLTILAVMRFARQPCWRWWLTLCICLVVSIGLSSSAIFLSTCLLACLVPLLIPIAPKERRIAFVLGSMLALTPIVPVGLLIQVAVRGDPAYHPEAPPALPAWYREWDRYAGSGSAEIVWLLTLPLLCALLPTWRSRALLIALPALLFITFANPLLQTFVSSHLTGSVTYYRLFWLYPVGLGLASLLALLSRLLAKLLAPAVGIKESWIALGACLVGLAVSASLPGVSVWSEQNSSGPFMSPGLSVNLEQMPAEVKVIARMLQDEPDLESQRIACGEEVASFLTPFSRRFRFAVTRPGYTMYSVGKENGAAEAAERLYMVEGLRLGRLFPRLLEDGWQGIVRVAGKEPDASRPDPWPSYQALPTLLDRYKVKYAIASPTLGQDERERQLRARVRDDTLTRNGFHRIYPGVHYSLWKRANPVPADTKGGTP
jgi:hypothetical protein